MGVVVGVEESAIAGQSGSVGWWWWWWLAASVLMGGGGGLFANVCVVDCVESLCGWVECDG